MTANRDIMSVALAAVYGPDNNLADWEAQHWVAEGFEPCGPGDKASWYKAEGASGTHYGDLEADYWLNVYAGGGGGGTPPTNTVAPLVSSATAALGNAVTVGTGTWTGDATITYTYQWQVSDTGVGGWSDISGETANSITIEAAEQGKYIRCVVTGTNGAGSASANSDVCAVESAGLTLLKSSTLWLDASDPGADPQKLQNKGAGGTALDARFGSTAGVDTNDPLLLPHTGTNYLYAPGASNSPTSPHIAAYVPSGVIDVRVRCSLDAWTATQVIMSHYHSGSTGNWSFRTGASNTFELAVINGAGTGIVYTSAAHGLTAGTNYWLRFTSEASGVTAFYYAADQSSEPSSWTQIGSNITSTHTGWRASTCLLTIGARGAAGVTDPATGRFYRAVYRTNTSTVVFDADFTANTNQSSFTESSSNAATVTINRATSGRKAVMVVRPTLLFGTDDYLEVADNDLLDFNAEDFTVLAVTRTNPNVPADSRVVSKRAGTSPNYGWELVSSNTASLNDFYGMVDSSSGNTATAPGTPADITPTNLQASLIGFVVDQTAGVLKGFLGSTFAADRSLLTDRNYSNTAPLSVGRFAGGSGYIDGEIMQVAVFRSALTSSELADIATYLGV